MQSGVVDLFVAVAGTDPVVQGLLGGLVIAGLNLVGASLVFVWRDPSERALDGALGFAAGVMLAAAFTSLIVPGIVDYAGGDPVPVLLGLVVGALVLDQADRFVPHVHYLFTGRKREDAAGHGEALPIADARIESVILFILAITLHNVPEGLAVGVGFGSGDPAAAIPLMIAIGVQNVPEGLAVAVAAVNAGLDERFYATLTGIRSGLVEVPLAVAGAAAVVYAAGLLPYAMGFAAGAMLFVISDEIVPETHARGNERIATLGTMAGVVVMVYLDVALA